MSDSSRSTFSCVFPNSQPTKKPVTREKIRGRLLELRTADSLRNYSLILRNKSEKLKQTKSRKEGRIWGRRKGAESSLTTMECNSEWSCHSGRIHAGQMHPQSLKHFKWKPPDPPPSLPRDGCRLDCLCVASLWGALL